MEPLSSGLETDEKCSARLDGSNGIRSSSTNRGGSGGPFGLRKTEGHGIPYPSELPADTRTPNPSKVLDDCSKPMIV